MDYPARLPVPYVSLYRLVSSLLRCSCEYVLHDIVWSSLPLFPSSFDKIDTDMIDRMGTDSLRIKTLPISRTEGEKKTGFSGELIHASEVSMRESVIAF